MKRFIIEIETQDDFDVDEIKKSIKNGCEDLFLTYLRVLKGNEYGIKEIVFRDYP